MSLFIKVIFLDLCKAQLALLFFKYIVVYGGDIVSATFFE